MKHRNGSFNVLRFIYSLPRGALALHTPTGRSWCAQPVHYTAPAAQGTDAP